MQNKVSQSFIKDYRKEFFESDGCQHRFYRIWIAGDTKSVSEPGSVQHQGQWFEACLTGAMDYYGNPVQPMMKEVGSIERGDKRMEMTKPFADLKAFAERVKGWLAEMEIEIVRAGFKHSDDPLYNCSIDIEAKVKPSFFLQAWPPEADGAPAYKWSDTQGRIIIDVKLSDPMMKPYESFSYNPLRLNDREGKYVRNNFGYDQKLL